MSYQNSELIIVKSEYEIKNENEIKEESSTRRFENVTDSWRWQSDEGEAKCGEIFVSKSGTFTLICANCKDSFENMRSFGEHIRTKHLIVDRLNSKSESVYVDFDYSGPPQASDKSSSSDETEYLTDPFENIQTLVVQSLTKHLNKDQSDINFKSTSGNLNNNAESKVSEPSNRTDSQIEQKWFCELCNVHYKTKSSLTRHNKSHKAEETPTSLEISDDRINSATELSESILSTSVKTKLPGDHKLFCKLCNRHLQTKRGFRYHITQHKTTSTALQQDPTRLKCKYCSLICSDYSEWIQHKESHKVERPYPCPHCEKTFKRRMACQMHINSHTGERPYKCPHCSKAFAHSNNLAWHVKRIHLKLKTYACELCDRRFTRNVEKNIHMRQHTGEKPYQCESCGKGFMLSGQLNEHRKRHKIIKDVKCPTCGKCFYSKTLLKDHMVKHSEERPHICSVCGNDFARRKALLAHQKLHMDIKEYVCNICGKAFAQNAGLYSHKKSHGIVIGS